MEKYTQLTLGVGGLRVGLLVGRGGLGEGGRGLRVLGSFGFGLGRLPPPLFPPPPLPLSPSPPLPPPPLFPLLPSLLLSLSRVDYESKFTNVLVSPNREDSPFKTCKILSAVDILFVEVSSMSWLLSAAILATASNRIMALV